MNPLLDITVAIPSIAPRQKLLKRALGSVLRQTMPAAGISVAVDHYGRGAGHTRNRAWRGATTDWVALLDDDDELLPQHLERLAEHQVKTGADMVYSWFELVHPGGQVVNHLDPFPTTHFTEPWDRANPRQTTITMLVRRDVLEALDGFAEATPAGEDDGLGNRAGEDWDLVLRLNERFVISHLAERTWRWHHHGANTSGLAERWHPSPAVASAS